MKRNWLVRKVSEDDEELKECYAEIKRLTEAYQSAHDRAEALAAELRAVKQGAVWHAEFNREYDIMPWNFDEERGIK